MASHHNRVGYLCISNCSLNKTTMEIVLVTKFNEKTRHLQIRSRAGSSRTVYEDFSNSDPLINGSSRKMETGPE